MAAMMAGCHKIVKIKCVCDIKGNLKGVHQALNFVPY